MCFLATVPHLCLCQEAAETAGPEFVVVDTEADIGGRVGVGVHLHLVARQVLAAVKLDVHLETGTRKGRGAGAGGGGYY